MLDLKKIANFTEEHRQLIATCVDVDNGDIANYSNGKVDMSKIDDKIREKIAKDVFQGEEYSPRTFRKYKNDLFAIIETVLDLTIPEGWRENEFFNRFVETRRVDLGDTNKFYTSMPSLLTVSNFSGNHWDTRRERLDMGNSFSVETSWWVCHFYDDFERFMKGIDSWTYMLDRVRRSYLQQFQNAIYTAFADLADYIPTQFYDHGTLSTATEIENLHLLLERVETANNGSKPSIVGTQAALRKLQPTISADWISDMMKNERNRNGQIGYWEGYDLVPLPQVFIPGTFNFKLPSTDLFIVSNEDKLIKFVYEGDSRIDERSDNHNNRDMSLEYQLQIKAGIAVVGATFSGVWQLA